MYIANEGERERCNVGNFIMGVLCAVEIINGVGEAFNIEETQFLHSLYAVITTVATKMP